MSTYFFMSAVTIMENDGVYIFNVIFRANYVPFNISKKTNLYNLWNGKFNTNIRVESESIDQICVSE